ncbi:hypothetical protein R1T43_07370 [Alteromonas sp. CI.11.F.A3]|nr:MULTISPECIES: hypothetical protein [unclassified Alteromonas]WOI38836.1 hypothetical protein R1T43_07370 [Alteromonas sp. CI.11.F.A3]|tara:strand:+ start:567 stop:701 length:135 start_codon:yes stop_codon:yes gene_type:complete
MFWFFALFLVKELIKRLTESTEQKSDAQHETIPTTGADYSKKIS